LWGNFWKAVQLCGNYNSEKPQSGYFQQKPSIIVTLGIGQDTAAEKALIKVRFQETELPRDSLFYGADPMQEINEELYSKFGTYFPIAVGSESKIFKANVLINGKPYSYVDRNVIHIELIYFLTQLVLFLRFLRFTIVYDDIWIDAEGAEYEMFPYFYRGGALDQNGITLCQFNLEIHQPSDAKKEMFQKFILQLLRDNRYGVFRIVQGRHMRLYFLNFSDSHCVSKYIFRSTS
ncbi:unnamed protein product, partial [Haemonchus placei]|uniref:Methyltransf_21 domain-containing protein n=1 Tax=Haemonchus placei TaxID=6290 RepID=A0A0N4W4A3_HAEPC